MKVKVEWFTERGHRITGLIHVGANDGYEVQWYREMGIDPVLCFEPLPAAQDAFRARYGGDPAVTLMPIALGAAREKRTLKMGAGLGGGSTFLTEFQPDVIVGELETETHRFDELGIDPSPYNTLVIDVQGMELEVLKGFGAMLDGFRMLNVECSRVPHYAEEPPASEVIAWLAERGFVQQTPVEEHDDILFLREGLRLNCGSGQRPFAKPWLNIDAQMRWQTDHVLDLKQSWYSISDGSADMVVFHHVWEHEGCGEALNFQREAFRVLRPGGSLLIFVPDLRALAQRWLLGQIDTQVYMTNLYGAFMGDDHDRHRWGYDVISLHKELEACPWAEVKPFDWRQIPGADIAKDWWVLAMEAVR